MSQVPVPPGGSTENEDAKIATHAAQEDKRIVTRARQDEDKTASLAAQQEAAQLDQDVQPGLDEDEPSWLDQDTPPDPDGDDRTWPGDVAAHRAQAERDAADEAEIRTRLLAAGVETGYAHWKGAPGIPGICEGSAGGFGQSAPWDLAPPGPLLAERADYASGEGRHFAGVCDDELFGLLGARQKLAARQAWERLMVIAELIRRRPAPGCKLRGPAAMPRVWSEGTAGELTIQLAITRRDADRLLDLAWDLTVKLPLTSRMLRDGIIDEDKAATIALPCRNLTPEEAMRAEQLLFGTPDIEAKTRNSIRDRIARAVMEVNPGAARRRREDAARDRRIEVRQEESGNASIAGRELPCAAVLALDKKLSARARQLKKLGVAGDMDDLRVLAFLERWGEADPAGDLARARHATPSGPQSNTQDNGTADDGANVQDDGGQDGDGDSETGNDDGNGGGRGPEPGGTNGNGGGRCPACGGAGQPGGVAGNIHLTAPVITMTEMAQRPGILRGVGPIDPALVRDLGAAAARNPATRYEFTLTDPHGRPVAHGCGTPGPNDQRKTGIPDTPGTQGPAPPALTLIDRGPPGTYGRWRYTDGIREIIFEFEDLAGPCDHRHQARGHDPGKHLRHLMGILHPACTQPTCRRPESQCDTEHSRPFDQGGITCLCTCGPVCRRNHRDKQQPGWKLEEAGARGWFRWITPSGRTYLSGPEVYPI